MRLSNSAASTAAAGTTERELFRETLTILSSAVEDDSFTIFTLLLVLTLAPELVLLRAIFLTP